MTSRISRVTIFALFLSTFLNVAPVSANQEVVLKNFTITGWDDAPVPNASVALFWNDAGVNKISEIKLTDATGQVSISIPKNAGNDSTNSNSSLTYGVVPPVDDPKSNAAADGKFSPLDSATDQALSVKLKKADVMIELIDTDGSSVKPFTQDPEPVFYVSEKLLTSGLGPNVAGPGRILRSGPFGLSLPNLDPVKTYEISLLRTPLPTTKFNRFSWRYAFNVELSGNTPVYKFFTDRTANKQLPASEGGVYKFEYKKGILNFLSSDGTPFVSTTSVSSKLCSTTNSSNCYGLTTDAQGNAHYQQATGYPIDGTYTLTVNSESYPASVSNGLLTIIGLTANQDGTYSIKVKEPNLKVRAVTSGTAPTDINNARVDIYYGANNRQYLSGGFTGSTYIGFDLLDRDDYWLIVDPPSNLQDQYARTEIPFKVKNGVVEFDGLQAVNGIFSIPLKVTNLQVQLVNPENSSTVLTTGNISSISIQCGERCFTNQGLPGIRFDGTGKGGAFLPLDVNQTYYLDVNHENYANKVYVIKVNQGLISVEDNGTPLVKNESGRFTVSPAVANVTGKVLDKDGIPLVLGNGKWTRAQLQKWDGNVWQPVNFAGFNVNQLGEFKLRADALGRYRVWIEPFGYDLYGQTPSQEFELKDDGFYLGDKTKLAALTGENKLIVQLAATNFKFKIVDPNSPSTGVSGWIGIQKENTDGNYSWLQGIGVNSTGLGGANLIDGKYRIEVNVNGYARKFYDLVVSGSGETLLLKDGATTVELVSGRFPLKPATANLTGVIKDANGGSIAFVPGTWVSINLQQWDALGGFWQWTPNWTGANSVGAFVFNVDTPGKYRLMAIPNGIDGLSTNFSDPFEFTDQSKFKVGDQLSDNLNLEVRLAAPNFLVTVVDPSKNNEPILNAWLSIFKEFEQGSTWVTNVDINSVSQGKGGAKLDDGRYRVEVNTGISGLSRSLYYVTVSGQNIEVKRGGEVIAAENGRFVLAPSIPNIRGRVLGSNGLPVAPGNNRWVNINLQRFNPNGYWEWTNNWSNTAQDGSFAFNASDEGKYRLRIEPNGYSGVSITYSIEFNIKRVNDAISFEYLSNGGNVQSPSLNLGDITLGTPSLLVRVAASEQNSAPLNFIGVEIRRNGAWIDWSGTGPSGLASISFSEEGNYELIVHPGQAQLSQGLTRKSYKVTVTKNQGSLKGVVDGLTAQSDGAYVMYLGSANLGGVVLTPDIGGNAGSPIKDIQVVARDVATGRDLWENQGQSGVDGKWAMSLPDGTYTIRAIIWSSTLYTNSEPFGNITVTNGTATAPGSANPLNLILKLSEPRWKGQVLSPDDVPVPFASVNAYVGGVWYGTNANSEGRFALSVPSFTNFSSGDFIEIRDDRTGSFPLRRLQKLKESDPDLSSYFAGLGCQTDDAWKTCKEVVFKFQGSNTKIKVMAGGQPAANIWVNIDADNVGWIGGGRTNQSGIASFNIDKNSLTGLNLRIRADVNGNPQWSSSYSSTMETVAQSEIVTALSAAPASVYEKTVTLNTPNFRAQLREPNNGPVASWAWVELFNKDTGEWIQGSGTDDRGIFTMTVPMPSSDGSKEFFLIVNPSWNSNANLSRNQYKVIATKSGSAETVSVLKNDVPVTTTSLNSLTYYELQLSEPSVRGVVKKDGTTAVRDSWVTPIDDLTGEYLWQYGANSKQDGSFALALPKDGKYRLEANVPWGTSGLARSSQCVINVLNGKVVSQETTCDLLDNVVQLNLRAPNLTMTLKKSNGTNVPFAWVGVCIERWCSGGQSGLDGKVSIFIDSAAVNQVNGWDNQTKVTRSINVYVDPPWGSSDIVRWSCQSGEDKPICKDLANFSSDVPFPSTTIGDVQFASPNLALFVQKPDGSVLSFAWVNLFTNTGTWLGGSNSDANGKASFNVPDAYYDKNDATNVAFKFRVEINPPWNAQTSYSRIVYGEGSGLLFSEINNQNFKIGAPNIVIRVKTTVNTVWNKWGWLSLEKDVGTDNWSWLGGFGLDVSGKTALTLEKITRYRLIAYPGPGASGTRRTCVFSTGNDVGEVKVTPLTSCPTGVIVTDSDPSTLDYLDLALSSGNVTGKLMFGDKPVTDALIYAVPVKTGLTGSISGDTVTVESADGLTVGMYLLKEGGVGAFGGVARIVGIAGNSLTLSSDTANVDGAITFTAIDETREVKGVSTLSGEFSLLLDPAPISKWRISVFPVKTIDNKTLRSKVIFEDEVPGLESLIDIQTIFLTE